MLGIESEPTEAASKREVFRQNPYHIEGRTLYYCRAIGTASLMADVIIDQVKDFEERFHES